MNSLPTLRRSFSCLLFCVTLASAFAFSAFVSNDNDNNASELDTWGSAEGFTYSGADYNAIWVWGGTWQGQVNVFADDNTWGLYQFANPAVLYTTSSTHSAGTYGNNITSGHATNGQTFTEFDSWLDFLSSGKNTYGP